MTVRSVVLGCGSYLPKRILTNAELATRIDTSDEWIVQRTGIRQRHIAADDEFTSHLGINAAKAALAANKQGKYVAFHRALYELRGQVDESKVLGLAKVAGLDVDRLKVDMQAPTISARLGRNIELAQTLGITGTPGFAVGNRVFSGATDLKWLA